jgi:hypothetical protein
MHTILSWIRCLQKNSFWVWVVSTTT